MHRTLQFKMENALMNDTTNNAKYQGDTMRALTVDELPAPQIGLFVAEVFTRPQVLRIR
jgi:hypothetical protein